MYTDSSRTHFVDHGDSCRTTVTGGDVSHERVNPARPWSTKCVLELSLYTYCHHHHHPRRRRRRCHPRCWAVVDGRRQSVREAAAATSSTTYLAAAASVCLGWMNRGRFCLQKAGSQEHISLITIMFCFNEFAFTVQVRHKINSIQIIGFIFYVCILRPAKKWPFPHVYFAKNVAYFPFNSWLSFQWLCRLSWGYHFHFAEN